MRRAAGALMLLAASMGAAAAQDRPLVLPQPLRPGETLWIEIRLGPIGRGREIEVATDTGRELGVVSPFGAGLGRDAGTFTLPLPPDAIHDGRVSLRLTITGAGGPPRPPTDEEVRSVKLIVGAAQ